MKYAGWLKFGGRKEMSLRTAHSGICEGAIKHSEMCDLALKEAPAGQVRPSTQDDWAVDAETLAS